MANVNGRLLIGLALAGWGVVYIAARYIMYTLTLITSGEYILGTLSSLPILILTTFIAYKVFASSKGGEQYTVTGSES